MALVDALDVVGDGAIVTQAGVILYVNDAFCAMTGRARSEFEGRPWPMDLLPESRQAAAIREQGRFHAGLATHRVYRTQLIRLDGVIVDVEASVAAVGHRRERWFASIYRDISRQVAIEARYEALLSSAQPQPEVVGFVNQDGIILSWNSEGEALLGIGPEEAIGSHYHRFAPPDVWKRVDQTFRSALETDLPTRTELELTHASGLLVPVSVRVVRSVHHATGEVLGLSFSLARRGHPPDEEHARIRAAFRDEVSHELRTPLAVSLGFLQTIVDRWEDLEQEARREFAALALASVERLFGTVEQLLATASVEQRPPVVTTVDLVELMTAAGVAVECPDARDVRVILRDDTSRGILASLELLGTTRAMVLRPGTTGQPLQIALEVCLTDPGRYQLVRTVLASVLEPVGGVIGDWSTRSLTMLIP